MLRFIKSSCYVIVNSGYEEFLSITKAPQRAMNVVLHCCQMQNPQGGLGVRIKAFEEVKTDEKLYIFIRSHLLSGHRILKFYVSMPMSQDSSMVWDTVEHTKHLFFKTNPTLEFMSREGKKKIQCPRISHLNFYAIKASGKLLTPFHCFLALLLQIITNHYLKMQLIANLKENRWKIIAATESNANFRKKNPKPEYVSNRHLQTTAGRTKIK